MPDRTIQDDIANAPTFKTWKDKRAYETGADTEKDKWVWFDHPTHSDWYSKDTMKTFIKAAKKHGVDPYDFLALGVSESGLGNQAPDNPTRVHRLHAPRIAKEYNLNQRDVETAQVDPKIFIDYSAKYISELQGKEKDRLSALQAYSGKGRTIYGGNPNTVAQQAFLSGAGDTTKVFGKDFTKIDFWKDKPQGKRVVEISDTLRKNPAVKKMVESEKAPDSTWPMQTDIAISSVQKDARVIDFKDFQPQQRATVQK